MAPSIYILVCVLSEWSIGVGVGMQPPPFLYAFFYFWSFTTECQESVLDKIKDSAVGDADADGFYEFKSKESAINLRFPVILKDLTTVQIKPPTGTKANHKFSAEVTYVMEDGNPQNMVSDKFE